jgi:hypothetical protein
MFGTPGMPGTGWMGWNWAWAALAAARLRARIKTKRIWRSLIVLRHNTTPR